MKRRFDRNAEGDLVDRHGYPLDVRSLLAHPVVSVTLDIPSQEGGALGGGGTSGPSEQQELSLPTNPQDGGVGEGDVPVEERCEPAKASVVWETYIAAMGPRDKTLHPAERKLINEALKVATVAECQRAILGCRRSPFHQGDNAKRKKYNTLSHILKAKRGVRTLREQIDFMLDLADKHGVGDLDATGSEQTVIDPAKLERMKRQVFRAFDMQDSPQAAEQAERAEAWLNEHGWHVVRNGNDRPKIERKDS